MVDSIGMRGHSASTSRTMRVRMCADGKFLASALLLLLLLPPVPPPPCLLTGIGTADSAAAQT
jgi:hypothetical protein